MPKQIIKGNVEITREELEKFLGAPLSSYDACDIGERNIAAAGQHDRMIHPKTLLEALLVYGIKPKSKELCPSRKGIPKTGEVWRSTGYGIIALYWASIEGRGHNVIVLGGDTYDGGRFDVIGSKDTNDDFYRLIFSPITGHSRDI